jgi:hypothetical protein
MSAFDKVIQGSKPQLPSAFTAGGDLPYSNGEAPRAVVPEPSETIVTGRVPADETTIPNGTEDVEDFGNAFKELGFEAIAFYISFHRPTARGWGIFYFEHRMRQFAEVVRRELLLKPEEAARLALRIVRAHEQFHFRFDAYALYHELVLHKPLYNKYSASVYRAVYCTADCFEEALANRSCLESEHVRRFLGRRIFGAQLKPFLKNLFAKAPRGYSDYERPLNELCSGLGGQLFEANPSARLPKPQSDWVSRVRPFRRQSCPEFFLSGKLDHSGKSPEFTLKRGGYKWRVHKSDPDRWPSKPHAHDYEANVKLSIKDGTIWDVTTKKQVDRVKKGDLIELRNEIMRRFPDAALEPLTA